MIKIKVRQVYSSTFSNSEDKPQVVDNGLNNVPETDYYDDADVLHIKLSCDHEEWHNEETEVDTFNPITGHDTYTSYVVVCDFCDEQLDIEPDFDEPDY